MNAQPNQTKGRQPAQRAGGLRIYSGLRTSAFELPFTRSLPGARPKPAQKAAKSGQKWPNVAILNDGSQFGRIRAASAPELYREEKREKGKEKVKFW